MLSAPAGSRVPDSDTKGAGGGWQAARRVGIATQILSARDAYRRVDFGRQRCCLLLGEGAGNLGLSSGDF